MPSDSFKDRVKTACAITLVATAALFLSVCRSTSHPPNQELIVSAAVSLKDAFIEIGQISEQRTGVKTHFNFGASGALQKQIELGAPADVFASAGSKQMDDLANKNLIVPDTRTDFARNALVLIQPTRGQTSSSFTDLTRTEINKIAVGNPKTVPAGQYTEQTFNKLKLLPNIQPKLIYSEDVRQVLDYVVRGEVDAGVVYSSDALNAGNTVKVVAHAPDDAHDPIVYPIAVIKDSQRQEAARKFLDLVLSSEGQSILVKHGFLSIR